MERAREGKSWDGDIGAEGAVQLECPYPCPKWTVTDDGMALTLTLA